MGSSNCHICDENDYLTEFQIKGLENPNKIPSMGACEWWVCRDCVETGIRVLINMNAMR